VTKSGIYKNLDNTFDFGSLEGLTNREAFVHEQIPAMAKASKDFFLLSSNYFVEGVFPYLIFIAPINIPRSPLTGSVALFCRRRHCHALE
jgi:hypothetical protein